MRVKGKGRGGRKQGERVQLGYLSSGPRLPSYATADVHVNAFGDTLPRAAASASSVSTNLFDCVSPVLVSPESRNLPA